KYQIFQISEISHCSFECLIKKVEVNFIKKKPKREDNEPIYNTRNLKVPSKKSIQHIMIVEKMI
ncbi:unnamed protein product, partial [Musa banksii]